MDFRLKLAKNGVTMHNFANRDLNLLIIDYLQKTATAWCLQF